MIVAQATRRGLTIATSDKAIHRGGTLVPRHRHPPVMETMSDPLPTVGPWTSTHSPACGNVIPHGGSCVLTIPPLILTFLGNYFVEGNRGGASSATDLAAALDDLLYDLNTAAAADGGPARFPQGTASVPRGLGRNGGGLSPSLLSAG